MSENRRRRNNGAQNRQVKKARTNNARRILLLVGLMSLVAVISIGGTIAWLTAETPAVTNTFTTAGIKIDLTETLAPDGTTLAPGAEWSAQLVPGKTYSKNPTVSVDGQVTNVDVYLFVKIEEDAKDYLDYTSTLTEPEWMKGDGTNIPANVWYRTVAKDAATKSWNLLDGNTVKVKEDLLKSVPDNDKETGKTYMPATSVTLKYTAYAIQTEGFATPAAAWAELNPTTPSNP